MKISFDGQVALVTGAGRGLGANHARELARRGAKVIVNDLGSTVTGDLASQEPADTVRNEIVTAGGEAVANFDSVATLAGGASMVEQALDLFGRLDVVVCNAGISDYSPVEALPGERWDRMLDVHAKGTFTVIRAAWPVFRRQGYGRAVLTTSEVALWGNKHQIHYAAGKGAVIGMMNALQQVREGDVTVNCVAPVGYSRMFDLANDLGYAERERYEQMKARARPDDVTAAVVFLASRECTDSGMIIEAMTGRIRRTAIVAGRGFAPGEGASADADWIMEHWAEISDITDATPSQQGP